MEKCHVLIPCGGNGRRFGAAIPKQYMRLNGRPMVNYCLDIFLNSPEINSVWVGISADLEPQIEKLLDWPANKKLHIETSAGQTRHETVLKTVKVMLDSGISSNDWILVHDAVRPGLSNDLLKKLITSVQQKFGTIGGLLALPVADSLKIQVTKNSDDLAADLWCSAGQSSRDGLWQAQTPQMFRIGALGEVLAQALQNNTAVTDEASAFENLGECPLLVKGSPENLKVTYPEDWLLMEKILNTRSSQLKTNLDSNTTGLRSNTLPFRIGQGYDVHELIEGRPLILGGVKIPHEKGLLGHSDADALLHAITDALLGSLGLGDIGKLFPDTDEKLKGADSMLLLIEAYKKVKEKGFLIGNIDSTIICQKPKLATHTNTMRENIANGLNISIDQINIKAKTNEGLGYLGKEEAIATEAVVMIFKQV